MPTSSTGVDEVPKVKDKEKKFLVMKETVEKCQQLVKKADTDEIDEMSTDEIKAKMIELTSQTKFNLAMLDYCEQKMKTKKTKSKTTTKFNIGFIYKGLHLQGSSSTRVRTTSLRLTCHGSVSNLHREMCRHVDKSLSDQGISFRSWYQDSHRIRQPHAVQPRFA